MVAGWHQGNISGQLTHFAINLGKAGHRPDQLEPPRSGMLVIQRPESFLPSLTGKKKKVIFIDEMAWFNTPRSKFLMAFENFWNSNCTKRNDLLVVICGSAASWMIQKNIE